METFGKAKRAWFARFLDLAYGTPSHDNLWAGLCSVVAGGLASLFSALDWWWVEAFEPDRRLRLWAEMKLPGRAWLEFEVEGNTHSSTIRQTAIFDPVGLSGLAYWYLIYPLHQLIFAGMLRGIVAASLREGKQAQPRDGQDTDAILQCDRLGRSEEPLHLD